MLTTQPTIAWCCCHVSTTQGFKKSAFWTRSKQKYRKHAPFLFCKDSLYRLCFWVFFKLFEKLCISAGFLSTLNICSFKRFNGLARIPPEKKVKVINLKTWFDKSAWLVFTICQSEILALLSLYIIEVCCWSVRELNKDQDNTRWCQAYTHEHTPPHTHR